jgi:hypothetical protein
MRQICSTRWVNPAHASGMDSAYSAMRDDRLLAVGEHGLHQVGAGGEAVVERADAHAGPAGDLVQGDVEPALGEHLTGGRDERSRLRCASRRSGVGLVMGTLYRS